MAQLVVFSLSMKQPLDYLRLTGRDEQTIALVEAYAKAQGLWHDQNTPEPVFTDTVELDLSTIEPSLPALNVLKIVLHYHN